MDANHPLAQLRASLSEPSEGFLDPNQYARLSIVEFESLLHVDFFGEPFDEPFFQLSELLRAGDVAGVLGSLMLRCPDEGMNGTCNWDLSALLHRNAHFPQLKLVSIQQNGPATHNRIIVGSEFEEGGTLGRLLQKAPVLDALIAPSAPDASFFEVREHPLRYLNLDAGYDTQNFIANLASSSLFPGLQSLEWGEYHETYLDNFPQGCTPFADYQRLFQSQAFARVQAFTLRNPVCTPDELASLRAIRPRSTGLQFNVVRSSSEYVSG